MVRRNTGRKRHTPAAQTQRSARDIEAELVWAWLTDAPTEPGPRQLRGGITRYKSYCLPCDLVLRGAAWCPRCGQPAIQMGRDWRPGRKGSRTRIWDPRVTWRRGSAVPRVVRQLGVRGTLPPPRTYWWSHPPDPVLAAIARRGQRQRSRRRRTRT
jgi:hypothetical protein